MKIFREDMLTAKNRNDSRGINIITSESSSENKCLKKCLLTQVIMKKPGLLY